MRNVDKIALPIAVCFVCIVVVGAMGGYSQAFANRRLLPIYSVQRADMRVAISFDAAWGADKTRQIMDVCDSYNAKATFFLVGFWVDKYPDMVAEIASRGFEIGTHSQTHPQMSKLSAEQIRQELATSCAKIFAITGQPVRLFRPPFGDYSNEVITQAQQLGLTCVQWSVDSLDWKGLSAVQIATRVQKAQSGDIILCHNNSDHIVEALPLIFEAMRLKNVTLCPVGDVILWQDSQIDSNGKQIPLQPNNS